MSALSSALEYIKRGWSVIPVPSRGKNPGIQGWQRLRISAEVAHQHFNGKPQNIGVLLGEPSGWLVDVDLDHPLCVAHAVRFLPPTSAIFGRPGKPRSHWTYCVTAPVATKKFKSKSAGMLVELRATGMQTVFPPSIHESGEQIAWEMEGAEPAAIAPDELSAKVEQLANAVRVELGEHAAKTRPRRSTSSATPVTHESAPATDNSTVEERQTRCLAAMLRMGIVDQNDGSSRLYAAACRAVEHGLTGDDAVAVLRRYERQAPFPRGWTDAEIVRRLRDAERACDRGKALIADADGLIPLGNRDPATSKLILSPKRTTPTAEAFIRDFHDHPDGRTIHSYAGQVLSWWNNHYVEVEDEAVRKQLQIWLHDSLRYVFDRGRGEMTLTPFDSNPSTVKSALETIKNHAHLPATTPCPSWLRRSADDPPATEILPCRSFLYHLPTLTVLPPTPAFFSLNALGFDPDPNAPVPTEWFRFLHQLFDGDLESLDLLQEWFGYCLTVDTSQQKMLFIMGPRRSGKGTIARVLAQLIGPSNVCGPTTSSLAGPFGLQQLIGKTVALVSDARFSGENIANVVERLLCISGEDALSVDRKFLGSVTMKLTTRFMFLSNELPRLNDASGALAGRFLILRLTQTFYGKEDPRLTARLLCELPSILNWAIEGWQRLQVRGYFITPQSVADAVLDLGELSSPISAFVRETCVVGVDHRVSVDDLYKAWTAWCEKEGRKLVANKQTFGRDLAAAFPEIRRRRGTNNLSFYDGIMLN